MTTRVLKVMLLCMTTAMGAQASVSKAVFGTAHDGQTVEIYTLKSDVLEVKVTTYGARIVSIDAPDRNGKVADVTLGYKTLAGYESDKNYFGAVVGRYGNRLANGRFTLEGHEYHVPVNNNGQSLHGGIVGFDKLVWQGKAIADGVELTLVSKDGDQGYPGTLTAHVRYTLHHDALRIDYVMSTDKPTVVNLTNHSYFNLSGDPAKTILSDEMMIPADKYTPVTAVQIPTGEIAPVEGTPFDFRKSTVIGARIGEDNAQLKFGRGYDVNWVLRGANGEMKTAARVYDPESGRVLKVTTTEPGVQFYSGNFLDGVKDIEGKVHAKNTGLCVETQHFPDSPNQPGFPSTELKPGTPRHSTTIFTFSTQAK